MKSNGGGRNRQPTHDFNIIERCGGTPTKP
jgi:hypothetical protein